VKMYVGSRSRDMSFSVLCMAVSSARRMFYSLGSLVKKFIFFSLLYIPYPAISLGLSGSSGFGGVYDPSV
jgi:hypothetical protein